MFANISEFLFGGTPGLNEAEERLLSFLSDALPPQDREILSCQLKSIRKVQRQHPERLVAVYYRNGNNVPRLPYLGYEYCLANISYKSGGRTRRTSLVLHDGRFMTFERNVPQRLCEIEGVVAVALHPQRFKGAAEEIDSQEHEKVSDQ